MYNLLKYQKAGIIACLFLFIISNKGFCQKQWEFDEKQQHAYAEVLNLEWDSVYEHLGEPKTVQDLYIISLAETLELLLTEDEEKFDQYESHFESRLHQRVKGSNNDYKFFRAELHLQWAFIYFKFRKELEGAKHLREAYHIAVACREKSPDYIAIQKTSGILEIIIGSVPEKYNWILGLFNMEGTIAMGLKELETVKESDNPLAMEAAVLLGLIHGYIFQDAAVAVKQLERILESNPTNRLLLLTLPPLSLKSSQAELALHYLKRLDANMDGVPLYYADYLKGEANLCKGDYIKAISAYRWFVTHFKGNNNIKDAYYKIGLCYWLNGNENDAQHFFEEAKESGSDAVEADKAAEKSLSTNPFSHRILTKVRYATDGGYYDNATELLNDIIETELKDKKSQAEYYYRKARLQHKTGQIAAAKLFYQQTVDMTGNEPWYFAPNACLQLGYLAIEEKRWDDAKGFFQKVLTFNKHEYKNSLDSKARSALARLKTLRAN